VSFLFLPFVPAITRTISLSFGSCSRTQPSYDNHEEVVSPPFLFPPQSGVVNQESSFAFSLGAYDDPSVCLPEIVGTLEKTLSPPSFPSFLFPNDGAPCNFPRSSTEYGFSTLAIETLSPSLSPGLLPQPFCSQAYSHSSSFFLVRSSRRQFPLSFPPPRGHK